MSTTIRVRCRPSFDLGQIVATPGALAATIDVAKPCKGFGANTLWIITEDDRSVTTFLLPDEY